MLVPVTFIAVHPAALMPRLHREAGNSQRTTQRNLGYTTAWRRRERGRGLRGCGHAGAPTGAAQSAELTAAAPRNRGASRGGGQRPETRAAYLGLSGLRAFRSS